MALQLTTADAKRAIQRADSLRNRLSSMKAKGEEVVENAARTLEVSASAFGLGVIQGAGVFKGGELFKIPLELFAGLAFHGMRLLGLGGKHGSHLSNFGDGALASYTHVLGRGVGAQHWGGGAKTAGTMGGDLADRLAAIANGV